MIADLLFCFNVVSWRRTLMQENIQNQKRSYLSESGSPQIVGALFGGKV